MATGVLITARLKSKRLPKKIIKKINTEDSIIKFLIKRIKLNFSRKNIVIITSKSNQDKILEKVAVSEKINIFKDEPLDVLKRIYLAAKKFKYKNFISCTADNPFIDSYYAKKMLKFHIKEKNDLTIMKGLPLGTFSYAINFRGLKKSIINKNSKNTETWVGYFTKNKKLKVGYYKINFNYKGVSKDIRLTIDYLKDLTFVREILKKTKLKQPSLTNIINILNKYPNLLKINSHLRQKPETKPLFKKNI